MSHSPDFLESGRGVITVRPQRWIFLLIFLVVLILVAAAFLYGSVKRGIVAWELANQGKAALIRAERLGLGLDFTAADAELARVGERFSTAGHKLSEARLLRRLPWVGRQVRATEEALTVGAETVEALRDVLSFGNDLSGVMLEIEDARRLLPTEIQPTATFSSLTESEKRLILARFLASIPKLEVARNKAARAAERFAGIPSEGLYAPLRRAIEPLAAALPRLRNDLDRVIPVARLLPAFAGYPDPKETLILFLNNAELRPGGGFVGTVGRMSVGNATVQSLVTRDAYQIDRPAEAFLNIAPPAPLTQYLGLERWFMRDANWSPDFKVSAELVAHFYERETSGGQAVEQINNVIGFTPTFAAEILKITGPIAVESQVFRADNLFDLLEYQVERGFTGRGIPFEQRKEILADLVDATIDALFELPLSRLEEVLIALERGFREKQLLLYDRDPDIQRGIEEQGWGGRIRPGDGDFLMVVDANLGSLKSDPVVRRSINYSIVPDGENFRATVGITYRHEGHFDWKTTRYRTYTRIYAPAGSEFIFGEGALQDDKLKNPLREPGEFVVEEDSGRPGLTSFGAFIAVEPGEERTLSINYKLAPAVAEQIAAGEYKLRFQKQLGGAPHQLTLDLDFGKTVRSADPPEFVEQRFDSSYKIRTDLRTDREFIISF